MKKMRSKWSWSTKLSSNPSIAALIPSPATERGAPSLFRTHNSEVQLALLLPCLPLHRLFSSLAFSPVFSAV